MDVLELMFITCRLPPYVRNRAKQLVTGMPKLHFLDTGLACHLLGQRIPSALYISPYYGALLETMVVTELMKHAAWAEDEYRFWHFRDRRGHEVDLVVENAEGQLVGVEVKASASIRSQDFAGLVHFADYSHGRMRRGIVLYAGANPLPVKVGGHTFHAVPLSCLTDV